MSNIVELLSVGTELLLGNIVNLDAQILSQGLSALGLNVYYHTVVGDNPARVREAVEIAKGRADIIITTGGLGPTCDDLTKTILAEAFDRNLVEDPETVANIRSYFEKINALDRMTPNNFQQALLPEGCQIFTNHWGTAPGCGFFSEEAQTHVLMLPGPPSECRAMFDFWGKPYLQALSEGVIASHTLQFFGIGESQLEDRLRDRMNAMENPSLAPYAKLGECELRVTAKASSPEEAETLMAPVVAELRDQFPTLIYGMDVASLEEVVLSLLLSAGKTLGLAESCTGGLVAQRLTDLPGASQVFRGGIVSYCDQVKEQVLGVPSDLLAQKGAVSQEVALAMAEGARRVLNCDVAVSITGVAGPGPDERGNAEGTVFVGFSAQDRSFVRCLNLGQRRARIRTSSGHTAFDLVRRYFQGLPLEDG